MENWSVKPNPELAAALRQTKVPKAMKSGKALVDLMVNSAENGVPMSDGFTHVGRLLSAVAFSLVEVINIYGETEARAQSVTDALKKFGKSA